MASSTIATIIRQACEAKANDRFITDEHSHLTGTELWRNINRVCADFESQGLTKGDVVAFYCGSSVPHAVTFFACLISGIIPCCLHVRETTERNRKNVAFIAARKIFADPNLMAEALALIEGENVLPLTEEIYANEVEVSALPNLRPDDPALILISSGTTGVPKCILHSQATLAATAEYGPFGYDCWNRNDNTIVIMAPSFAAWIHTVLPFVFIKGQVVFGAGFDPAEFLATLARERITLAPLVPTVWRMVMAAGPENYDLSHLRTAFFSGEPGSQSLIDDLRSKICDNVMTSYLASEGGCASGIIADTDILTVPGQAAATGRPVSGAELRILNPDGGFDDQLPIGEVGEIALKSASVAVGYYGDDSLTEKKFANGWWRSSDLGYVDHQGLLFVKGRLDNRINTGGIKVYAEEIEAALLKHPAVQLVAVVGHPHPKWGQRIEAHVVATGEALTAEELMAFCLEEKLLPKTHVPKAIYFHDTLPTGPTGKLYRRGLTSESN